MRVFRAGPRAVGSRLDVFIAGKYPQFSRSSLVSLLGSGAITLNGKKSKAGASLRRGDRISVDESILFKEPKPIDLPIIYQDDDVVVISKPSGLLTHSKGALNTEATLASFIRNKLTDKDLKGNRAGIVHRLDRATSGVIITAKTARAQAYLQKQFSLRKAVKSYLAVVEGWPKPEAALIDAPIERSPKKPQTFRVGAKGKPAKTRFRTIKKFIKENKSFALLEVMPVTGRTHQIRVHLAYIGHPVVGDALYGKSSSQMPLLLHASQLEITLPNGERKVFSSPEPNKFKDFLSN